ncbi:MAG TPA: SRPBCC domain-containing protein [Pseudoxanthomonas sp.]|nr:SRPBCC domain-containing protein [Pseudoxanthomonas sp.]
MVDILHRVGIVSAPEAVHAALATRRGLSGWWTDEVEGEGAVGDTVHFQFGERGFFDMEVLEAEPGKRLLWRVVDGPQEWIGTRVSWDLRREGDYTIVLLRHEGWKEPIEFMHHCSTKWAVFLLSLKALVETGKGMPFPHDVKIDDWN